VPIAGANSFRSVSCSSSSRCVAVDVTGHTFVGTAPSRPTSPRGPERWSHSRRHYRHDHRQGLVTGGPSTSARRHRAR
jgi:hypothetical protein